LDEARREALKQAAASGGAAELGQSVDAAGQRIEDLIDGVRVRPALTHPDERGTVTEVFDLRWEFDDAPLVFVYQVTIRAGRSKGWVLHRRHADRSFFSLGAIKVVLYDERDGSPTRGRINEFVFGAERRVLLYIPSGVWHRLDNVGSEDALFINCPTEAYRHDDPDKWILPDRNDVIPYDP
jgi:dTDP-4-dehydrorhamnose 3,5-epimerase